MVKFGTIDLRHSTIEQLFFNQVKKITIEGGNNE